MKKKDAVIPRISQMNPAGNFVMRYPPDYIYGHSQQD